MTELVNFIEGADFSKNKVAIKKLIETPITKEIQISLPKGIAMKEHCAPYPITVMLVQGDLDFYVNDEKFHLKIGDLIYTGTPAGVGPIAIGDQLNAYIEDQNLLQISVK